MNASGLKISSIILKIVELMLLLAVVGCVGYFVKEYHKELTEDDPKIDPTDLGVLGRFEFFLYTAIVGVLIAVGGLVALCIGQHEKNGAALAIVHALWALQLLASSVLLLKVLGAFEKEELLIGPNTKTSYCDVFEDQDKAYECRHIKGGVACGFLAAILFLVDTIVNLTVSCKDRGGLRARYSAR